MVLSMRCDAPSTSLLRVGGWLAIFLLIGGTRAVQSQNCSVLDLQQCSVCLEERAAPYNCDLPGLGGFRPGQYEGVTVNYLSFVTETSSPNMLVRAKEFEECTGGTIVFSEAENVWEDPVQDLGTRTSRGSEVYDGYFMSYSHFPEMSALGLAEHLNDRIRDSNNDLKWEDILPKVRSMGEYRKNGVTNIDFLMYDGDFFVPIIRLDLLEKHDMPLPNTWQEVVDYSRFFNGTDLNEDGEPDFGFCHFPRLGAGYWDWWWTEAVYSTWATTDQLEGINQGFFFDKDTMDARIGEGFRQAAETWKDLWTHGSDGCITPHMSTGRCAIGFAPPGCWKGVFLGEDGVSRKDSNGTVVWRPTMKSGEYAEPYRFKPFGSTSVVDRQTGELRECTPELCPKAEEIPSRGHFSDSDRASLLPPSPLQGKLINRAPFYWSGGLGTLIRKSSTDFKKDLMWDFFVYTNSPYTSVDDVAGYASWLDSWRQSQLTPGDNFIQAGWSRQAYEEHAAVMKWALSNAVNGALNLRIPGLASYTRDVLGVEMKHFIEGSKDVQQFMDAVRDGWNTVTLQQGKLNQLEIYRAALGLDSHSEVELCRLHRNLMDRRDPSICRKYDETSSQVIVPVVAVSSAVVLGLTAALFYFGRKRMMSDKVWQIKPQELGFDDPPEILGRGTFGLVLLAEYRGTEVAVKRVIPPKASTTQSSVIKIQPVGAGGDFPCDQQHCSGEFSPRTLTRKDDGCTPSTQSSRRTLVSGADPNRGSFGLRSSLEDVALKCSSEDEEPSHQAETRRGSKRPSFDSTSMFDDPEQYLGDVDCELESSTAIKSGNLGHGSGRSSHASGWLPGFMQDKQAANYKKLKADFIVEMRYLSKLRHPSVTTFMGAVLAHGEEPMLVMEYMDHGSLYDILHNETIPLDGELLLPIQRDIASGLRFLHSASPQVVHGDLKAANVLVDGRFRAKVADFGLSAKKAVGATGTPLWMAPELLRGMRNTAASDVYSFGIILYEIYSRKDPYEGMDLQQVLREVADRKINRRPPVPHGCPGKIAAIMKECQFGNAGLRPTFEEVDLRLKRLNPEDAEPREAQLRRRKANQSHDLLLKVFPPHIAAALEDGRQVEPEKKQCVTVFFSDVVGFTELSSLLKEDKVSDMLERLYNEFDKLSLKHDVFSVDTIGDAYMGATNLVKDQSEDHVKRIAAFALDAVEAASRIPIDTDDPVMGFVQIRAGFHTGPVIARVVGSRSPKYSIFGDTVNVSSRMESHSLPGHVHCSDRSKEMLVDQAPEMKIVSRGTIHVKGKGEMVTYFVHPPEAA